MPLGNELGEFAGKIMSVRQTDLGSGQLRVELDATGEAMGQVPGQWFSTMVIEVTPGRPSPYSYTVTQLLKSGGVLRLSGRGVGVRTGDGHKVRFRGSACLAMPSEDPQLAAFNNMISAVEFEVDLAAMTVKGVSCEWR